MAEGLTHEDATLALRTPMILAVAKCSYIEKRQNGWIEAVYLLRVLCYLLVGRKVE